MWAVPEARTRWSSSVVPVTSTGASNIKGSLSRVFEGVQNEAGLAHAIPLANSSAAQGAPTGKDSVSRVQSFGFVPTRLNTATPVSTVTGGAGNTATSFEG